MSKGVVWVFPEVAATTLRACVEAQGAVDRLYFPEGKPQVAVAVAAEAAVFQEAGFLPWGADEEAREPRPKTHPDGSPFEAGTVLSVTFSLHAHIGAVGRPQCWYRVGPHPYAVDIEANVWFYDWDAEWGWRQGGARFAPDREVEKEPESPCAVCGGAMEYEIAIDGVDVILCFDCRKQYVSVTVLLEMEVGEVSRQGWAARAAAGPGWDREALRAWWEKLVAVVNARRVEDGRTAAPAVVSATRASSGARERTGTWKDE